MKWGNKRAWALLLAETDCTGTSFKDARDLAASNTDLTCSFFPQSAWEAVWQPTFAKGHYGAILYKAVVHLIEAAAVVKQQILLLILNKCDFGPKNDLIKIRVLC
jgi:hypothetical protein